jgi:hypothetical protein
MSLLFENTRVRCTPVNIDTPYYSSEYDVPKQISGIEIRVGSTLELPSIFLPCPSPSYNKEEKHENHEEYHMGWAWAGLRSAGGVGGTVGWAGGVGASVD